MPLRVSLRFLTLALVLLPASIFCTAQQSPATAKSEGADLQFAVILTRHGVRPPTNKNETYAPYSAAPWPEWSVQPGYLTAHGYELMKMLGGWDRAHFAAEGLLAATGCADASRITILADSDERTRESGRALAEGMMPGCTLEVQARPEGTNDPLFSYRPATPPAGDSALAAAAISGRIGGDAKNLTEAWRPQLAALDRILAGCGKVPATNASRTSIFDVPASLPAVSDGRSTALHGPVPTASSLSENLLLEYAEGMTGANLGWGCLDEPTLYEVLQLHSAEEDIAARTWPIARMRASNLLDHILRAMEQSASGQAVAGASGKKDDRLLILSGHDTNIANVAGALGLDWIEDGRRNDTPPGGALLFELWRERSSGQRFVRMYYMAQTLDQMRQTQPLSEANPPVQVPLFVPGCSRADLSCSWEDFQATLRRVIDPAYVMTQK
jgi:4-phytase/acid phosphatase